MTATAVRFLLASLAAVGIWFAIAPRQPSSPAQHTRRWLAGTWAFVVWFTLPSILRTGDPATIRGAVLVLVVFGALAFGIGYGVARWRRSGAARAIRGHGGGHEPD